MFEVRSKELGVEYLKLKEEFAQFKSYEHEASIIHKYKKGKCFNSDTLKVFLLRFHVCEDLVAYLYSGQPTNIQRLRIS